MFIKLSATDCDNIIRLFEDCDLEPSERETLDKVRLIRQSQKLKHKRNQEQAEVSSK